MLVKRPYRSMSTMLTIELEMVIICRARNPISFTHILFRYPFLESRQTKSPLQYRCPIKISNRIRACLPQGIIHWWPCGFVAIIPPHFLHSFKWWSCEASNNFSLFLCFVVVVVSHTLFPCYPRFLFVERRWCKFALKTLANNLNQWMGRTGH